MKKLLLTLGLIGIAVLANAQGTIAFGNNVASRITIAYPLPPRLLTSSDGFTFGVFFGPAGSGSDVLQQAPGTATIGATTPGVMTGAPSVFALPGTEPGQVVSMQIRGWNAAGTFLFFTDVRQVTLGPTAGPGTVIWQSASGINPNRFNPPLFIPEPSTIALGALAGVCLLFRARKSIKAK